ncbi:MAG: 4-alpha-glucanotransferase [Patescibacteria group bacterium]|jgi:4-alpha-glucanotransferase
MQLKRSSGILLHPTSLPGRFGIGDLGPEARHFVDWLAAAKQTWWEMLPIGPTGHVNSPFSAYSTKAGNALLLSPEDLVRDGWLTQRDIAHAPSFPEGRVDFHIATRWKRRILRKAYARFIEQHHHPAAKAHFHDFAASVPWLRRFSLFMALKYQFKGRPWWEWPADLRAAEPIALKKATLDLKEEIRYHQFLQWQFSVQWHRLRTYAEHYGVQFIGNFAFYPAHDSEDVWAQQRCFNVSEKTGRFELIAGVPGDYFNENGQFWGNPTYRWRQVKREGWKLMIERMDATLEYFSLIKLDHFRGYLSFWEVPAREHTARNGQWQPGPGKALFTALKKHIGTLPFIVEDLGDITDTVHMLRDELKLPGLRVLQFGLGSLDPQNFHLPQNYPKHTIGYTGTHDNNTFRGWFTEKPTKRGSRTARGIKRRLAFARRILRSDDKNITNAALDAVWNSSSVMTIAPMQDILNLPGSACMNRPGRIKGNWDWRLKDDQLTQELARKLAERTKNAKRL